MKRRGPLGTAPGHWAICGGGAGGKRLSPVGSSPRAELAELLVKAVGFMAPRSQSGVMGKDGQGASAGDRHGGGAPVAVPEDLGHGLERVGIPVVADKDAMPAGHAEQGPAGDGGRRLGRSNPGGERFGRVGLLHRDQGRRRRHPERLAAGEDVVGPARVDNGAVGARAKGG